MLQDNPDMQGKRHRLIDSLEKKGIQDRAVLQAMRQVPRHLFIDSSLLWEHAYQDKAFPIAAGQTISQPYTVAFQTQLLQVKPSMKVMEVGTGSGYQGAILMEMGCRLFSIERQNDLYLKANKLLNQMGYHPHLFYGDGYEGKPTYAPFDRILITAAAPEIPKPLLEQLKIGGKLVVPLGASPGQTMVLIEKEEDEKFTRSEHGLFEFVPMLRGVSEKKS